jgi:hypothetical protein
MILHVFIRRVYSSELTLMALLPCQVSWKLVRFWHTHELTPWSRVLPENLAGPQLLKKFPAFEGSVRFRGHCVWFVPCLSFYGELLAPRPTPKLEGHALSAVRDCLFNIFPATLHIWRPFLHPQPEDAPCRGDTDRLITKPSHESTSECIGCHTVMDVPDCTQVGYLIYSITQLRKTDQPKGYEGGAKLEYYTEWPLWSYLA